MPYVGVGQILDTHMCADTVWLKRDQIMHALTYRVDEKEIPIPTEGVEVGSELWDCSPVVEGMNSCDYCSS